MYVRAAGQNPGMRILLQPTHPHWPQGEEEKAKPAAAQARASVPFGPPSPICFTLAKEPVTRSALKNNLAWLSQQVYFQGIQTRWSSNICLPKELHVKFDMGLPEREVVDPQALWKL